MTLTGETLRAALFGQGVAKRFTQDSPVLPEVWLAFAGPPTQTGGNAEDRVSLLLTPHRHGTTAALSAAILEQFAAANPVIQPPGDVLRNEAYVKGSFTFEDLVCRLLPLSGWYQQYLWRDQPPRPGASPELDREHLIEALQQPPGSERDTDPVPADLTWLVRTAGLIALARARTTLDHMPWESGPAADGRAAASAIIDAFQALLAATAFPADSRPLLWRVNLNRTGTLAVWRARQTINADAAELTYKVDCSHLRWAVIDTGIDAGHAAFRRRAPDGTPLPPPDANDPAASLANRTRIVETYDFTRLTSLLQSSATPGQLPPWETLQSQLRVSDQSYAPPAAISDVYDPAHGTHVAGILAGDWRASEQAPAGDHDLQGICPTLEVLDLRVVGTDGSCEEFTLVTALQFVRYLNQHADEPVIHGVNISLQFPPDPTSFAPGYTPICEECERLVSSGVVVVVAAGNSGFEYRFNELNQRTPWFTNICIADPGTAESVITVGSTHREKPRAYGVSYFSSRGPTPDGRVKPDLVAPGEKIVAPVPSDGKMAKDGTSMAAPQVSGAAALIMARNSEYIGRPAEVKRLLMSTATDLGRERNFQGAGLVDALRALGSA
jgi:serine protease AprX